MADQVESWWVFPGFELEIVAEGLDLPVNLAFVPNPGSDPKAPLFYVTELYGQIKAIANDGTVHAYATGLLNYPPDHKFPGSGESGVTGICVEPETGDLFVSMIYLDDGMHNKVVRTSSGDGLSMRSMTTVIDNIPSVHAAHQIQALSIGFDRELYVNVGDGMLDPAVAQDDDDLRGKVLRLNPDGSVPDDNPKPGSPVYAKGLRNPFGATWRRSDRSLYISDNGPSQDDRIVRVHPGENYGWPETLRDNALFLWEFCHAPTALGFMQDGQFPDEYHDHLFVALFGLSYFEGRGVKGKRIAKLSINEDGTGIRSYDDFVLYTGEGPASPCGLAFGPGGLYFTDLHGQRDGLSGSPTGNIYRVRAIE